MKNRRSKCLSGEDTGVISIQNDWGSRRVALGQLLGRPGSAICWHVILKVQPLHSKLKAGLPRTALASLGSAPDSGTKTFGN